MGEVLNWLSQMLINLDLSEEGDEPRADADDDDELDEDFVLTARPWLHTKEFHEVSSDGIAQGLWGPITAAEYIRKDGEGGSMLLLLPQELSEPLLERIVKTVREVISTEVNPEVCVSGCHPTASKPSARSPVPLIQLFLDSPTLLVDGSMSDAASFL